MLMYAVRLLNQYPKQKLVIYLAPTFSIIRPEYNFLELARHDIVVQQRNIRIPKRDSNPQLQIRVPLGNSDIFLSKHSSKNIINIYVRASIHLLTLITMLDDVGLVAKRITIPKFTWLVQVREPNNVGLGG